MNARTSGAMLVAVALCCHRASAAVATPDAIAAATSAFAKIDDYRMRIAVHESAGTQVENRTYDVLFRKPSLERVDVVAGPGKGSGVVWIGGETVKAHRGGLLGGIRMTVDIHNSLVSTLRGDAVDSATIPSMLADFAASKGQMSQAPGPVIDGVDTTAVSLDVADPATDKGVTRVVLYLSDQTHLPVRRERFVGAELVKTENMTDLQTNVGLTPHDFPW